MFDRAAFANVFKPVEEAESLPPWCYTSQDFYDLEVKNLFMRVWNFFGHVDQVAKTEIIMANRVFLATANTL